MWSCRPSNSRGLVGLSQTAHKSRQGRLFLSSPALVLPSKLAPAPSQPLRIVSKRARRDTRYLAPRSKQKGQTKEEPASEWPKPMQYAFGVACAVAVPYGMAEATVQYGPLREYVIEHHPDAAQALRTYFGQALPLSYYDALQLQQQQQNENEPTTKTNRTTNIGNDEPMLMPIQPVHVLPGEHEGSVARDNEIKRLLSTPVQVMIHPLTETSNTTNETVVTMDAKLGAWNSQAQLSKAAGIMDTNHGSNSNDVLLALDFCDETETHGTDENHNHTQDSTENHFEEDAAFTNDGRMGSTNHDSNWVEELASLTYAFSLWTTNFPSQSSSSSGAEQKKGTIGAMTAEDVRRSKLEWEIQTLQTNLQDPNCMRDRDEMMEELKQAKRQLFSLKWKRRLGRILLR